MPVDILTRYNQKPSRLMKEYSLNYMRLLLWTAECQASTSAVNWGKPGFL